MKSDIDSTPQGGKKLTTLLRRTFKLINDSVFAKTIQNIRKRVDVKLVKEERKRTKLTSQPTFKMRIFMKDLEGIEMSKKAIILKKPIYCGMTILDNSKVLIYDFHNNYIKQ